MDKKTLVLAGLITAMVLSANSDFVDDNVKNYYKNMIKYEINTMTDEEKDQLYDNLTNGDFYTNILS